MDSIVSVPTGGLVVASALAFETVKPLMYVRSRPKEHGTSKSVEGVAVRRARALMIDDVATTGGSIAGAVRLIRENGIRVSDAHVVIDRMEGAEQSLEELGVRMHSVLNVLQITEMLHRQNLVERETLERIRLQSGR